MYFFLYDSLLLALFLEVKLLVDDDNYLILSSFLFQVQFLKFQNIWQETVNYSKIKLEVGETITNSVIGQFGERYKYSYYLQHKKEHE